MNKHLKIALIAGSVLGGGFLIYRYAKKKKAGQNPLADLRDVATTVTNPVVAATKPANTFPLRVGSRGDKVKELQTALGLTPADGIFGTKTEAALKAAAGVTVVSDQAHLDTILQKIKQAAVAKDAAAVQAATVQTNIQRATTLLNRFKQGGVSIMPTVTFDARKVIKDAFNSVTPTNSLIKMYQNKVYSNTDYILTEVRGTGNLIMEITTGDLKGLWYVDPSKITLK